jgi:hypothetical protein
MYEPGNTPQGDGRGPRKCDVHVISAVRADTGWLMRLRIHAAGGDREISVRIPGTADAGDALERIKAACDSVQADVDSPVPSPGEPGGVRGR